MTALHSMFSKSLRLLLLVAGALAFPNQAPAAYLIHAQQPTYQTEPRFIRDRFAYIDSLPFDGLTISTETGRLLMNGSARSSSAMALDFGPLTRLVFKRMKHNFAVVHVRRPADFFDDWSVTVENFRRLAGILRQKRIAGIFFDNEEYAGGVFNYPADCSYPAKSLAEYQAQARARGREIMEAMVGVHPTLVVVALHGPYSSFSGTPDEVRGGQTDWRNEQLRGAFSAGLIEGLGHRSTFVDGGEVYAYRSEADFQHSYAYRKETIASAAANCPFIPEALRPLWPSKVSIAFGVYNLPFGGAPMDPAILRTTLQRALQRADKYVWVYTENTNWNAPGEVAQEWIDAGNGARAAALSVEASPWVTITSPGNRTVFSKPDPIILSANASSPGQGLTKVEFFRGASKVGESLSPPFDCLWSNPPAGTHRITAKATSESGATAVSIPVTVTVRTAFATRINFQAAGVSPSVSYFSDAGDRYGARDHGLTYGWNVSHQLNSRLRNAGVIDLHLATLCQLQAGAIWEIAVPNGGYSVTVGIGDSDYPSTYTINVEGVSFWAAQPQPAGHFVRRTRTVNVTDGHLTLDQGNGGFESTRLNYLTITGHGNAVPR